jgi:hypothetical protein
MVVAGVVEAEVLLAVDMVIEAGVKKYPVVPHKKGLLYRGFLYRGVW